MAWHLFDPPRTETAFASALPLAGLDAWRVYVGLPLSGSRLPPGGYEELMRRASTDAVLELYKPVISGAAQEFPALLASLRSRLGLDPTSLGLLGGSIGAAVAQLVAVEAHADVDAMVLASPLVQLRAAVDAMAQQYGMTYTWSAESETVAQQLDFVRRAGEFPHQTPVLLLVGAEDEPHFRASAMALRDALHRQGNAATAVQVIPGMAHALGEEPGIEAAAQTTHAATVDRLAVSWFQQHLSG